MICGKCGRGKHKKCLAIKAKAAVEQLVKENDLVDLTNVITRCDCQHRGSSVEIRPGKSSFVIDTEMKPETAKTIADFILNPMHDPSNMVTPVPRTFNTGEIITSDMLTEITGLILTKEEIPRLVAEYVALIETDETDKVCRCQWIIHPDDVNKPKGKRRRILGAAAMDCPVHTKEGFLLGFFEWHLRGSIEQKPKEKPFPRLGLKEDFEDAIRMGRGRPESNDD